MLDLVIEPRETDLGHGLMVRRVLPSARRRLVGPFVFYDHAGPVKLPPDAARKADVRPHPHIGLATVTYLLSGAVTHRDSLGCHQIIRPGEVNWMTAGRGISHSERFEGPEAFAGPGLELLQSWVALPEGREEIEPAFDNYPAEALPVADDAGVWLRVIAGEAFALASPVRIESPLFYVHATLRPGARLEVPAGYPERAAYLAAGTVALAGEDYPAGRMLVFREGVVPVLEAREPATVFLLGGEPVGERTIWWNFVSSRRERIEEAKADWRAGRIPLPPQDDQEFIPLPD